MESPTTSFGKRRNKYQGSGTGATGGTVDIDASELPSSTFDVSFKYYKRRCPPPDLTHVIDFSDKDKWHFHEVECMPVGAVNEQLATNLGLKPVGSWKLLGIPEKPGLLYIPNPFTVEGQSVWIDRSVCKYTCKPSRLNLDAHPEWRIDNSQEWWQLCCKDDEHSETLRKKLRWATLGYHHNWSTKVYSEHERSEMPHELVQLMQLLAQASGFPQFRPEAAIINFYHLDSTLAGHVDQSEQELTAPLFSLSFGQRAIFLLGGHSKSVAPVALMVHSGDVLIMSGDTRLSYHAVPRVIGNSCNQAWQAQQMSHMCSHFLSTARINLNVRQVLNRECSSLQ